VHAHINETQTAETPIECPLMQVLCCVDNT